MTPRLIEVPGGPFAMWPQGVLRAAGFAIDELVALGRPDYAAAVDAGTDTPELAEAAADAQAAALAAMAGRADFREAVAWQNHKVVEPMIDPLARREPNVRINQSYRRKQRIVARYWTRYAAKNDTIGFSGASCWFGYAADAPAVTVHPGPARVRTRDVFFENWPIDALAAQLATDPEIAAWLPARLNPMLYLDGDVLLGSGQPETPTPRELAALRLCDGTRTAGQVAAELDATGGTETTDGGKLLASLCERSWVCCDLEPPLGTHPDRWLAGRIERIGADTVRRRARRPLEELDAARTRLCHAPAAEVLPALEHLHRTFTALTDSPAQRNAGQTYGSRGLVYLDCTRDLDLTIGPELLAAFGPPLSLLLHGARWLTHRIAEHLRGVTAAAFEALVAESGADTVRFLDLMPVCAAELFEFGNRGIDRCLAEYAALWQRLLRLDTDARTVELRSEDVWQELEPVVRGARPGWSDAARHGVDLQLAASGAEAIRAGRVRAVLGEMHSAWNATQGGLFRNAHPNPTELDELAGIGVPPRVWLTPSKNYPRSTTRTVNSVRSGQDWALYVSSCPAPDGVRTLPMAGLEIHRTETGLRARGSEQDADFDVLDVLGMWLAADVEEAFKRVGVGLAHTPRVSVDRLVVLRESWTVPIDGLALLARGSEHETFVRARRWAGELGLPRFVFVKLSTELKPFYLDLTSPVQVAVLATALRAANERPGATVTVTEMLPAPEETWLPDADGHRFTSELRLQFVDSGGVT